MQMNSFCFILRLNTVEPDVFFDLIPEHKMVKLQEQIHKAETADDAQKIINEYV